MPRLFIKNLFVFALLLISVNAIGQKVIDASSLQPNAVFENIHVQKIEGDSNYTAFVIWIKKEVALHYHAVHTETIVVLEGKGKMTLGDSAFIIKKHDTFVIPKGTKHAVITKSRKPLKVVSIQYPMFDGKDRIIIKP
jgi:mannose-6-phosphate isomerase-like protein (cupin superfamily)